MSTPLSAYDVPFSEVENTMINWAKEALELRYGAAGDPLGVVSLPQHAEGREPIVASLRRVRQRLDRVEELQAKAIQARGRMARMQKSAEFEAQRKYDEAAATNLAHRGTDYSSARERNSVAAMASFEEKRTAHLAERLVSISEESLDVIKNCYWGLSNIREEHLALIRPTQFMTSTEVTT